MSSDISVRVSGLSKSYHIYNTPTDRLKQIFMPKIRSVVGMNEASYYREFCAFRDVHFEVAKGQTLGILGRNGSGKSTLLQIISGTLAPTSGVVETRGRISALLELGAGFNPDFTGRENVYMNGAIQGQTQDEINDKFDDIAEFASIGEFINQPVKTYSSGMYIRLAFACAVHVDPDILIVDEALAVGDSRFQLKCLAKMQAFQEQGKTILLVTHDIETVKRFTNSAIVLDNGEMIFSGNSVEAAAQYYKRLFSDKADAESRSSDTAEVTDNGEPMNAIPTLDEKPSSCDAHALPREEDSDGFTYRLNDGEINNADTTVYGHGGLWIRDVSITGLKSPNVFSGGEELVINVTYELDLETLNALAKQQKVPLSLMFGIRVENQKAITLTDLATTQAIAIDKPLKRETNKKIQLQYVVTIPNLQAGDYFLSPGIALGTTGNLIVLKEYVYLIKITCSPDEIVLGLARWDYSIIPEGFKKE